MRIRFHRYHLGLISVLGVLILAGFAAVWSYANEANSPNDGKAKLLQGTGSAGDWTNDAPGVRHLIRGADLPAPYATPASSNGAKVVSRPPGSSLKVPAGFKVEEYASGLQGPRLIRSAPNGDIFVAESGRGRITVLRGLTSDGRNEKSSVFAEGLSRPFGIAFYPPGRNPRFVYVAQPDSILRFPYKNGDLAASGPGETLVSNIPGGKNGGGAHWTRDICFTPDGRKMFVSVGSHCNALEDMKPELDERRAAVLVLTPQGKNERVLATGLRNPVALAVRPGTRGELWSTCQEREGLGDDLPADFVTRVADGGFYGWPWFYSGSGEQPTLKGQRPELKDKTLAPDVLLQPHSAAMQLCFYTGLRFPREYRNDIFVAMRGSSGRKVRTGYKVVRIHLRNGVSSGEYEDFLTGFIVNDAEVFGRPVGITTGADGALYVSEDVNGAIYRISFVGRR
jgi:glucose/arabinose dehydrogenase